MGFGKDSAQRLSLGEEPSGNALGLKSQANFCLEVTMFANGKLPSTAQRSLKKGFAVLMTTNLSAVAPRTLVIIPAMKGLRQIIKSREKIFL